MTTKRTIIGLAILLLGIWGSYNLWFIDDVSDASGVPALLTIWICSGAALIIIFWHLRNHKKLYWLPIVGAIAMHIIMDVFMNRHKKDLLLSRGQATFAVVSFRDKVKRAKTTSEEIRYTYYVEGKPFFKYSHSENFILAKNIKIGDTLIISYLPERPHWHSIVRLKTNYR